MAKKIFRFHQGQDVVDWENVTPYGDNEIDKISDPTGGSARKQITSIPSPFARIDLFRTGFRWVANDENPLDGSTIYHRLVSESLDIGQIFFNYENLKSKIIIRVWDKQKDLQTLLNSTDEKHRLFGETLKLYLSEDAAAYNFDLLNRLFLIEFQHKIIGGTSPSTMFFSSGNDLGAVGIRFGNTLVFDDKKFTQLYQRDAEFQKFIYHFVKANPILRQKMKEFSDYLNKNLAKLSTVNPALFHEINSLQAENFERNYPEANLAHEGIIDLLGCAFRFKGKENVVSDFTLKLDNPERFKGENVPLVLQNGFNKPFRYVSDAWDYNLKVPYFDAENDLSRRNLPGQEIKYPYLTVSDFLEPYLVRTVFPINKNKYFDGNLSIEVGEKDKGYTLPIKPLFFEFFSTKDLQEKRMTDGKPMFEMVQITGAVRVTLRIPVQRDYVTFERLYFQGSEYEIPKADEANNKGYILENQFGVTLFPFIRTDFPASTHDEKQPENFYRVQLIETDYTGLFSNNQYDLAFFRDGRKEEVGNKIQKKRSRKQAENSFQATNSQYYVLNEVFDYIQVRNSFANSLVIPKWKTPENGNNQFSFAIDFGTTNTHIEFRIGERGIPEAFKIQEIDSQIATLFEPDFNFRQGLTIKDFLPQEFLPFTIGKNSPYKFPQRTAVAENDSLEIHKQTYSLADFNIPFLFEKEIIRNSKIVPNLKWAKRESGNTQRIQAFFDQLMMMLRTKVLMNGGNLQQTKLVWFYPSSMRTGRIDDLRAAIEGTFERYFASKLKPLVLTESLAPFYYYSNVKDKNSGLMVSASDKPAVSIDIGGGTTDVVIFRAKKSAESFESLSLPYLSTSFKFATNAIFGDGFGKYNTAESNGFVAKYADYFDKLLATNRLLDLQKVLADSRTQYKAEDVNTFLFDLENNASLADPQKLFSYNTLLSKDGDMKLVVLYFYCAVVYHIARMMKTVGIERPNFVFFSGTGSKILDIISSNSATINHLTQRIFKKIYGNTYEAGDELRVVREQKYPKEVTCKGGLMVEISELMKFSGDSDPNLPNLPREMKEINYVYAGTDDVADDNLPYSSLNDAVFEKAINEVRKFNNFMLELHKEFDFHEHFSVSENAVEVFKKEANVQLKDNLLKGLAYSRQLDDSPAGEKKLEETLFFYPIIGSIHLLSTALSKSNHVHH